MNFLEDSKNKNLLLLGRNRELVWRPREYGLV